MKVIGLSVDPLENHETWAADIAETQGQAPNYPLIADTNFAVSKLYGMLPAETSGDPLGRTPADNQTVRNVFVIGPDKTVRLILVYPMTTGRNFDEVLRVIDSLQLTARHKLATPVNWRPGEDVNRRLGVRRGGGRALPRLPRNQAVLPRHATPVARAGRRFVRFEVAIVGGGPAGLAAALVLGRMRRRVLLVDADDPAHAVSDGVHGLFARDGIAPREPRHRPRPRRPPSPGRRGPGPSSCKASGTRPGLRDRRMSGRQRLHLEHFGRVVYGVDHSDLEAPTQRA